uniref:non-reducing end alpha-L-arabinofuranosidase n=1 Tax=Thermorudis peleae TaxID=1382356 RepID=A0A831TAV2_9BACT
MARIKIDLDRRIGTVDRRIFGGFIEHLGRCIYGGIFDEGSPLSDERGFRLDVVQALRDLRIPVLRWPGGNFASGYHWVDGIGPRDQRPRRMNLAWHIEESNRFGTDEFIAYCRLVGAEPYICVNLGSGTIDEAQAWVEYCNGTGHTYWANLRRQHGYPEPYGVKLWGLGNEMYGSWQIGALSADDYVAKAREFSKVMRMTDPSIQLVSCGWNGWSDWDRVVLEGLARYVDYHSIHLYTGSPDYYGNVLSPHLADFALASCQALIDRVRYEQGIDHPIYVAYDEWNVWFRQWGYEASVAGLEERYTLADALAVATYLNIFIRNIFIRRCRTVRLANLAQMVNVIAPIFTNPEGLFLQSIYHPFRLYSEWTLDVALDAFVEAETYHLSSEQEARSPWRHRVARLGPFALLDAACTVNSTGEEITLAVVNRDLQRAVQATIEFVGTAVRPGALVREVNGPGPDASNSFDQPAIVSVSERALDTGGWTISYEFPAHSVTLIRFHVA